MASNRLHSPEGTARYVNVLIPRQRKDSKGVLSGDPKYQITLIFDEDTDVKAMKKAAQEAGIEKFGPKFPELVKKGKMNWPFVDNEDKVDDDDNPIPGFENPGCSVGFKSKESGVEEILKSISGFWNRDATITEGNFTIGPTRVITKIISNFKNGNFENATKEDVGRVIQMVKKMDPPSSVNQPSDELGHIKHLSGMSHNIDEASTESAEEFAKLMSDFKAKHSDADIDELVKQYKDQEANDPSSANYTNQMDRSSDATQTATVPSTTNNTSTSTNNQTGTIDGQPASHADAMAKFRDIAKGMKLKMPGADGQDMDFDFSDPDKMGSQIQSHVGNMMKGMMNKMPQGQQKLDMPGFSGSMDPQAMMKGMMDKMPKTGNSTNQNSSTSSDNAIDFKPADQANLLQVDNPEYVARRAAALKKPGAVVGHTTVCLLYTSPSPRDRQKSRMPSSA